MSTTQQQPKRNSRWSRDPVIGSAGTPRAVYPTDRDIGIFQLLVRYRYLPSDTIHAFVGGNAKALLHRLNLLSRKPNLYLSRPHQQRQNAIANYRPLIYQLDERGSRFLQDRGLPFLGKSPHHNFAHELMVAQIAASIELGIRVNRDIRLVTWPEILAHDRTPLVTRRSSTPTAIRVSYTLRGEQRHDDVYADAQPFGLERQIDGKPSYLFFPGIEADCATEPIDASDSARSSIAKKFAAYPRHRRARLASVALWVSELLCPLHHHDAGPAAQHDGAARPHDRSPRFKDHPVQDFSELHLAGARARRRPTC